MNPMKTKTYETREEWLADRRGKVTGSRLKDIVVKRGTGMKKGYYELIAERLTTKIDEEETPMDRGTRLESEGIERFAKETGMEVSNELIIWSRDEDDGIAISPDGVVSETEAVEVKCLSSASHIEAWLTKSIPGEYEMQGLQYFIVNDALQTLNFVFYDPRIPAKDYFVIKMERMDVQDKITEYLEYQRGILKSVDEAVLSLTF